MKKIILFIFVFASLSAKANVENPQDTVHSNHLNEVIITVSTKETNDMKALPASVSFITPNIIEGRKLFSIKDLSSIIPNFYIPDYGSKLSVPVYIRGIGERSTGQSIGMYVDNTPYLDKSLFDFEFMDISQIEVLRGPQGTLYGRNAMSGIINIRTYSPLESQFAKFSFSAGNYGLFRVKASASELLRENIGLSMSAYYNGSDGYFKNQYSGEEADKLKSGGARFRLDWKLNQNWTAQFSGNYDKSDQGAFPYGLYSQGDIASPNYDYPGNYEREVAGGSFNLNFENNSLIFNSNSGFQYFNDDMKMDTDNRPGDYFTINQLQKEKAWTQEFTIKSNTENNYQWSFGVFGFYNDLQTDVVTTLGTLTRDEIQNTFDGLHMANPNMPYFTIKNERIPIPGVFKTPTYGGAIFHQSTYNNLFTDGLSATAGIRLDYEKAKFDYDTHIGMDLDLEINRPPMGSIHMDSTVVAMVQGKEKTSFTEVLPKIALKYEFDSDNYIYATASNGYKTGGYNIQMMADVAQNALMSKFIRGMSAIPVKDAVSYKPEYSWNYEIGFKGTLIEKILFAEIAAYYIDVRDIQITDFVESGQGRIIKNAGKAKSLGIDLSLSAYITDEFGFSLNYGFTRATFKDYKTSEKKDNETITVDYSGNFIPFAPQNTLSLSAVYNKMFRNKWIDRFNIQAQYNAAGKIYWTEANDVHQDFYGLLNVRAGVNKGIFGLNIWVNNLLDTDYTAFYFESLQNSWAQKGKPLTFGVDFNLSF